MASKAARARDTRDDRSYYPNDKCEVLSSEEGFSDAWATATCISFNKGSWLVEYSKFVDSDGKNLRERVRGKLLPACLAATVHFRCESTGIFFLDVLRRFPNIGCATCRSSR